MTKARNDNDVARFCNRNGIANSFRSVNHDFVRFTSRDDAELQFLLGFSKDLRCELGQT